MNCIYLYYAKLILTYISMLLFLLQSTTLHYSMQGYSNETIGPYLELHYNYAVEKLEMGVGYSHVSTHPYCSFLFYDRSSSRVGEFELLQDLKIKWYRYALYECD